MEFIERNWSEKYEAQMSCVFHRNIFIVPEVENNSQCKLTFSFFLPKCFANLWAEHRWVVLNQPTLPGHAVTWTSCQHCTHLLPVVIIKRSQACQLKSPSFSEVETSAKWRTDLEAGPRVMHHRNARCWLSCLRDPAPLSVCLFMRTSSGPIGRLLIGKIRGSGKAGSEIWWVKTGRRPSFYWGQASFSLYLSFISLWLSAILSSPFLSPALLFLF